MDDAFFMREALQEAHAAFGRGECAVGAVLVRSGEILARAGNRELELHDPSAHAEILVLGESGRRLGQHTFPDCTVYTTLWPCPMCEGAMLRAGSSRTRCASQGPYERTRHSARGIARQDVCLAEVKANCRLTRTRSARHDWH